MVEEKQIISEIVDNSVEEIFNKLVQQFKLESGDFSPEQTGKLEDIKGELKLLFNEYVEQNK